jgi:hypothetical protein
MAVRLVPKMMRFANLYPRQNAGHVGDRRSGPFSAGVIRHRYATGINASCRSHGKGVAPPEHSPSQRCARSLRASAHFNKRYQHAATQRVQTTYARLEARIRNGCVTIVTPRDQKILRQGKKTLASVVHRD